MEPVVATEGTRALGIRIAPVPPSERLLSPNEAGRLLNVTAGAVKQWIRRGRLPATKQGKGYWAIKAGDVKDFVRARSSRGRKRIMVIGAGPGLDEVVAAIGELGQEAVVARSATDALLKAANVRPATFIVDLCASGPDPWALIRRLGGTCRVRGASFLLVADRDLEESESAAALGLGIRRFLRWPFKAEAVAQELRKAERESHADAVRPGGEGMSLPQEQQKALREYLCAPRLKTVGEICRRVGCSLATLYRYKLRWGITRSIPRNAPRFRPEDVEQALRKGRGRTLSEIAKGLGMHPTTLSVYKRMCEPDPDTLAQRLKEAKAEVRRLERLLRKARRRGRNPSTA
jgi:excisionase family DNA binding protein